MARYASVISVDREDDEGAKITRLKVDPGGDTITVDYTSAPGDDSSPLPGDSVALDEDNETVVGFCDTKNADTSEPGEVRRYGRDGDGAIVCSIHLKKDGTILISNDEGSLELGSNGTFTINGLTIDTNGNLKAPGEVTAKAGSPGTSVALSTHLHGHPMGPTLKPNAGT